MDINGNRPNEPFRKDRDHHRRCRWHRPRHCETFRGIRRIDLHLRYFRRKPRGGGGAAPRRNCHPGHVSKPADVERVFTSFQERFDRLDILVNNAGVSGPTKPVDEITNAEWQATLDVNITGILYMVRAATPLFRKQRSGAVINMSSVAGRIGMPLRTPYSVSKYAVRGLTDVLAIELGEIGVRVNSLLPGLVHGPRGQRVIAEQAAAKGIASEEYEQMFLHNISMHAKIQMEEIADMAAFLGSDLAPHVSGQSISVDGNFESYRAPIVA